MGAAEDRNRHRPDARTWTETGHQPSNKTFRPAGSIFQTMRIEAALTDRLDPRSLRDLTIEHAIINALFSRLAENIERLQPEILRLRCIRFFFRAANLINEIMAVRILLAVLEDRLLRLRQDLPCTQEHPRFLFLFKTAVRALTANLLRTPWPLGFPTDGSPYYSAPTSASGAGQMPSMLPDLAEEPADVKATAILRKAAIALPRIRRFA